MANASHLPSGRLGSCSASSSEPFNAMRGTSSANATDTELAATIATSGAGTFRTAAGAQRHATSIAMTKRPRAIPAMSTRPACRGRAARLCHAELCDSPPRRTWICCRAMVIPMPASIACTTIGEMASATRPTLLNPKMICSAPAHTVIAHVTAQPNSSINVATITVRPAAGPLTCRGEPPSAPATIPPTTAAIRPARGGASEATAIPSDSGRATRNTTRDAGRS